jgi:hypothetical protein
MKYVSLYIYYSNHWIRSFIAPYKPQIVQSSSFIHTVVLSSVTTVECGAV